MKRSTRPWLRPRPAPTPHARASAPLAPGALALGLALLAALAAGCVTRGTHEEVVQERDKLAAENRVLEDRVSDLQRTTVSLENERAELIDQLEDLRETRGELEERVARLREAEQDLTASLAQREAELAERRKQVGTYEDLVAELEEEVTSGQIQIQQLREGLSVNVQDEILFASGSASIGSQGAAVLQKVAAQLKKLPHDIEVQGHTDNVPVRKGARFPSNWELGAARAAAVVRLFQDAGIDKERLRATSFADTRPVESNATPEGRARNRRIEIRLEPAPARPAEPAEASG